jgi:hypothetical protein
MVSFGPWGSFSVNPFLQAVAEIRRRVWWRYYVNDLDREVNDVGVGRIRAARGALKGASLDRRLRRDYERTQLSKLPGTKLDPTLFESIRKRAVAALEDPVRSPCCYLDGDQGEKEGVPKGIITHAVRRYTTDVAAVIPDAPAMLNPELVHTMRSLIGSNFTLDSIFLTRNFHVEPHICSKYELLSDSWHFDHQYPDGFGLWVCLSHVTEDDGPLHVVNAPDSRKLLKMGFDPKLRYSRDGASSVGKGRDRSVTGGLPASTIERLPSFTRLTGEPGTLLMCHTSYCLHRAGLPAPRHTRDMLFFCLLPTHSMDLNWPRPCGRI